VIATAIILWSACLLRGEAEIPAPPPTLQALLVLPVDETAAPRISLRSEHDLPAARPFGDLADDEDDSDDELAARLPSPIAPLAVASTRSLLGWLPRHGIFRTPGRSPVLRC
jgi:hypothetical protein